MIGFVLCLWAALRIQNEARSTITQATSYAGDTTLDSIHFMDINWDQFREYGAFLHEVGVIDIFDCNFTNCQAYTTGGAGAFSRSTVSAVRCRFENLVASLGGSFYFSNCPKSSITSCIFNKSETKSSVRDAYGGALFYQDCPQTTISDSFFYQCSDSQGGITGASGGAIAILTNMNISIDNCQFSECSAKQNGGVIYSKENMEHIAISSCSFKNTSAGGSGGVLFIESGTVSILEIVNTVVESSSAAVLSVVSDKCVFRGCQISNVPESYNNKVLVVSAKHFECKDLFIRNVYGSVEISQSEHEVLDIDNISFCENPSGTLEINNDGYEIDISGFNCSFNVHGGIKVSGMARFSRARFESNTGFKFTPGPESVAIFDSEIVCNDGMQLMFTGSSSLTRVVFDSNIGPLVMGKAIGFVDVSVKNCVCPSGSLIDMTSNDGNCTISGISFDNCSNVLSL